MSWKIIYVMILWLVLNGLAGAASMKPNTKSYPKNYQECQKATSKTNSDSKFLCVYQIADSELLELGNIYSRCDELKGLVSYVSTCDLKFYNSEYDFPKNFEECSRTDAGHVYDREWMSRLHRKPKPAICVVEIPNINSKTIGPDRHAVELLAKKCIDLGGMAGGLTDNDSCTMTFTENL